LKATETKSKKLLNLLSLVGTTNLNAIEGKPTKQCFTNGYAHRNRDFDRWLPANQRKSDECDVSTFVFEKSLTLKEAAVAILGVSEDTPLQTLSLLLKEHGHTMTLTQVESMVERMNRGETSGMPTNGCASFFFVEKEDGSIAIAYVHQIDCAWCAHIREFSDPYRREVGRFLLVPNVDTSKF